MKMSRKDIEAIITEEMFRISEGWFGGGKDKDKKKPPVPPQPETTAKNQAAKDSLDQLKAMLKHFDEYSIEEGGYAGHAKGLSAAHLDRGTSEPLSGQPKVLKALESIMLAIKHVYDSQPTNEDKEAFETHLLQNMVMYAEAWRAEREAGFSGPGPLGEPALEEAGKTKRPRGPKDSKKHWDDSNDAYLDSQGLGHMKKSNADVYTYSLKQLRDLNKANKPKKRRKKK